MQYLVRLTDRAQRDTKSIYEYVERTSIESAFAWFSDLEEAVYSLERYSERGRFIPENKKLRQLLFGEKPTVYRIIYAVDKHRLVVNIVHIRHVRIPLCANFVHRDTAAFRCNRILGSAQNIGHRTSMTDGEGVNTHKPTFAKKQAESLQVALRLRNLARPPGCGPILRRLEGLRLADNTSK